MGIPNKSSQIAFLTLFSLAALNACGPGGSSGTSSTTIETQGVDAPDGTTAEWAVVEESANAQIINRHDVSTSPQVSGKVVASSKTHGKVSVQGKKCTFPALQLRANARHRLVFRTESNFGGKQTFNTQASGQSSIKLTVTGSVDVSAELNGLLNLTGGGTVSLAFRGKTDAQHSGKSAYYVILDHHDKVVAKSTTTTGALIDSSGNFAIEAKGLVAGDYKLLAFVDADADYWADLGEPYVQLDASAQANVTLDATTSSNASLEALTSLNTLLALRQG